MPERRASIYDDLADIYADGRPSYPTALFEHLAQLTQGRRRLAWDCGTGPGHGARGLAPFFDRVIGSDVSANTIALASRGQNPDNVEFRVGAAESSGLEASSVDLVTAAQAVHQFDLPRFFQEVQRVLRPGGVLAVWCYLLPAMNPEFDEAITMLYRAAPLYRYWPNWISLVESGYERLPTFCDTPWQPFEFTVSHNRTLKQIVNFCDTWVATLLARQARDAAAEASLWSGIERIADAWGERLATRTVTWHLRGRAACMRR